mgnify:CR=1 FL=1
MQQSIKLTTVIKLSALYIKNITVCKLVLQTLIYAEISYIFTPINAIVSSIIAPVILAYVFYYILNPLVNLFSKKSKASIILTADNVSRLSLEISF